MTDQFIFKTKKGGILMKKFILCLKDSNGHTYVLCANVKGKNTKAIKKKIEKNLWVYKTKPYRDDGIDYPAKDPKILQQLKEITGYDFVIFEPDLYLSFDDQTFHFESHVRHF